MKEENEDQMNPINEDSGKLVTQTKTWVKNNRDIMNKYLSHPHIFQLTLEPRFFVDVIGPHHKLRPILGFLIWTLRTLNFLNLQFVIHHYTQCVRQ